MKLFKMLFSKLFISFLVLLLQLGLVFYVFLVFRQYLLTFQIVSTVFSLLIFLYVVNKKEAPEFKLPWLVILFVMPLFGTVIYVMFANSGMSSAHYRAIVEISCKCKKYSELSVGENVHMDVFLGEYKGLETFLRKSSFSRGYMDSRVGYFSCGEDFYKDLLSELRRAEKFIFMEYFIIDYGSMWNGIHEILLSKAAQGVEVRIMYDDIGSAGLVSTDYYKRLRKEGINCVKFNPFRPVLSGIHNNRDHRKITVIDGRCAYTGGINLADEYINAKQRFGHWKDSAVRIDGPAVGNLTAMFLQLFDMAAKQQSDYEKYLGIEYDKYDEEGYVHPFGDGPKPFYTEYSGENNFINMINSAKSYVYITTPYLICDHNLTSALRNAAMRGVDVRIITPHIPDKKIIFNMTRSNYSYLWSAGVKIYEYMPGFIHSKNVVADGRLAFVGTVNFDYRSFVHHYECGVLMCGTPCIADIKADFENTLAVSRQMTADNFKMNPVTALGCAFLNIFSPML